jgi:hypothetical protein
MPCAAILAPRRVSSQYFGKSRRIWHLLPVVDITQRVRLPQNIEKIPPAAFNMIVEAEDNRILRRQQPQQNTADHMTRPGRPIQHPMEILKLPLLAQAHHPQCRGDSPLPRCQDGANQHDLGPLPNTLAEYRLKVTQYFFFGPNAS